jgi:polyhydroxyalkanoate synthesis regulator phasin
MRSGAVLSGIILATVALSGRVFAQTATDIELTRANIQHARQAIIAEAMPLTEEESLAFWPAYRDYRLEIARVDDRLVKLITEFVNAGATLTDEQANRMTDEMLSIKAAKVAVRQKYVKKFRTLLPPVKVARFFQLENKLDAVVEYDLAQTIPLTQ